MAEKLIQLRVDDIMKSKAEAVLNSRGLTMTTAIRMMIYHIAETGQTPFDHAFDGDRRS